jgi:hypothetical protein
MKNYQYINLSFKEVKNEKAPKPDHLSYLFDTESWYGEIEHRIIKKSLN